MRIHYCSLIGIVLLVTSGYAQAMAADDLVKVWSQLKEDVRYGKEFIRGHPKATRHRKDTELRRFKNSCDLLKKHLQDLTNLDYDRELVTGQKIAQMLTDLNAIYKEIELLPLRNPNEKCGLLPPSFVNSSEPENDQHSNSSGYREEDEGSGRGEQNDDLLDPDLQMLFGPNLNSEETDPLLSENPFRSYSAPNLNEFDDIR